MKSDSEDQNCSSEPHFSNPGTPTPYLGIPYPPKFPKKVGESSKWPFKNDSRGKARKGKRNLKEIIDAECERCSDCVRECEVFECLLWQYRTKACKVHRGHLERLRKTESLSDEELEEVQRIYELEDRAMRRVFDSVQNHCPSKLRTFIRAYSGKSRASAIKAYEVWMANYDLTMVEPIDGGSE